LNNFVHVFMRELSAWVQLMTPYNMRWWGWRRGLHQKWWKTLLNNKGGNSDETSLQNYSTKQDKRKG